MTEITVIREMKNGEWNMTIEVDGETFGCRFLASRKITGTTSESGLGIFNEAMTVMSYGENTKAFYFRKINWQTISASDMIDEIRRRVKEVREWTDSLDKIDEIRFVL